MTPTIARVIGACLLFAIVGCVPGENQLLEVFGSPETMATVRSAETVTAQRLVGEVDYHEKSSEYEAQGEPLSLSPDQAERLRNILLDAGSYRFDLAKGCMPVYGVRLRFQDAAGKFVDVLLCFDCKILTVYDESGSVGGEDFDGVKDRLAELMKQLFPNDPAIAEL